MLILVKNGQTCFQIFCFLHMHDIAFTHVEHEKNTRFHNNEENLSLQAYPLP